VTTLITGAGLVAAHTGRELQAQAERIAVYDLAPSVEYLNTVMHLDHTPITTGDITNLAALTAFTQQLRPETIVHTAGLIGAHVSRDPYRGVQVNIGGSMVVMEAARVSGVRRVVFCSSMAIFDFHRLPTNSLITEASPMGPKNLYGATKLACEHLLTQYGDIYGIEVVHLRLAGVYGRGQYHGGSWMGRVLNRVLEASLSGQTVTIQSEWIGTNEYVYVKDVARAFALACLSAKRIGGAYNIGTGVLHTFPEVIAGDAGRAAYAFVIDPPMIDSAAIRGVHRHGRAKAVEDLNLVEPVQIHAGIRAFGEHELEIEFHVSKFLIGHQVDRASPPSQNSSARSTRSPEASRPEQAVPQNIRRGIPSVLAAVRAMPADDVRAVEERTPSVLDQKRRISVRLAVIQLRPLLRQQHDSGDHSHT